MFTDRLDAGLQLSLVLKKYQKVNGIVLAIPRGGVPVGYVVAKELGLPLEIVLSKKNGHPLNSEFAIGSVSMHGVILNNDVKDVPQEYIKKEVIRIQKDLEERYKLFMGDEKPTDLKDKIVIIVDDGIATGSTMLATIQSVRRSSPAKIIVAIPVGSKESLKRIQKITDEVFCILEPNIFYGVGQFYYDFNQVGNDQVLRYLEVFQKEKNE